MVVNQEKTLTPGVDSARRVLQVLLMFSEDRPKLTVEEIVRSTGISVPSAYRYLSLLKEMAFVEETSYRNYSLTPRVLSLGRAAEAAFTWSAGIHPALAELSAASGESALVMRRLNATAVCADMVEANHAVRLSFTIGHVLPLHRGAGAKVLLAQMGDEWCDAYLVKTAPEMSPDERQRLLHELGLIRERGWAHSSSEVDEGIWASAAPIRSGEHVFAALTVAGPRYRIDLDRAKQIHDLVISTAAALSRDVGGPS